MTLMLKELNRLEILSKKEKDKLKRIDNGQFNKKPIDN
jgi:hypothetical protein